MKMASVFLVFAVAGFLIGNSRTSPSGPGNSENHPSAVTFLGQSHGGTSAEFARFLSHRPPGSRHSREELLALMTENEGTALAIAAMRAWAKSDSDGTSIQALRANGYTDVAWKVLGMWSTDHPREAADLALEWYSQNKDELIPARNVLTQSIDALLKSGDESAVHLVNQVSGHLGWSYYHRFLATELEFMDGWGESQITQRLSLIEQFHSAQMREMYSASLIDKWAEIDPDAALEWWESYLGATGKGNTRIKIFQAMLNSNPNSAVKWASSKWEKTGDSQWPLVMLSYAQTSPDDPFRSLSEEGRGILKDWIRNQDRGKIQALLKSDLLDDDSFASNLGEEFSWMDSEIEPPVYLSASITSLDQAKELMRRLEVNEFTHLPDNQNLEQFRTAIELHRQSGEPLSPAAVRNFFEVHSGSDSKAALRLASDLPEHLSIEAADSALASWFRSQPKAAREYVDGLPDTEFRRYAVERVARDWLTQDPEPAIQWVNQMPRGIDKDIGRREVASTFLRRNPVRAYHQANAIDHPVIRDEALESVFRVLFQRDPGRANELLGEANLGPDRREEIARGARQP